MFAIYKKELRSYLHSMIGFVFVAFFLAIIGIYYFAYNLYSGYANFEYVLDGASFVFVILVPVITMRMVAEEKKQKTDQLLYTSPIPVWKIMLGKYLAVLTLFGVVLAFCCIYPLFLKLYGEVQLQTAYCAILGFALMGAAFLAIGLFISSLTESQVLSAVITFLVLLLCNLMGSLTTMIAQGATANFVMLLVCLVLVCVLLYFLMKNVYVSAGVAVIGGAALTFIYIKHNAMLEGAMSKILDWFSISERYNNFQIGILDLNSVLYYLSLIAIFLFITIQHTNQSMMDRSSSGRMFRTTISILLTGILVVVNLGAAKLDWNVDLSQDSWFSITKESKEYVKSLKNNITIYQVVSEGNEDEILVKVLEKYDKASSHIKVQKKDQVKNPGFVAKYTSEELTENSCIVVNEDTEAYKVVSAADMYQTDFNYETYQSTTTGIDMEGLLTSAIQAVTSDDIPVVYQETGHGENEFGSLASSAVTKMNVTLNTFSTLTDDIPEDCDVLVVNGPTTDFSEAEAGKIKEYLKNGGNAIFAVNYEVQGELPNYESILSDYHVKVNKGVVAETEGYYVQSASPFYLVPDVGSDANTVGTIEKPVISPASKGLTIEDYEDEDLTVTSILDTSEGAYSKTAAEIETFSYENGDIKGPFSLGAAITDAAAGKVVVLGSAYLFDDEMNQYGQFGNLEILSNSIGWMAQMSSSLSIPVKSVNIAYLSITNPIPLAVLVVFVIPGVFMIAGFVIWLRRRRA